MTIRQCSPGGGAAPPRRPPAPPSRCPRRPAAGRAPARGAGRVRLPRRTGSSRTASALSSGWPDVGSTAPMRQRVDRPRAGGRVQRAEVKRREGDPARQAVVEAQDQVRLAAARAHEHLVAAVQAGLRRVQRVAGQLGRPGRGPQRRRLAGAGHRVPLVGQAAGGEQQREAPVGDLGGIGVRRGGEAGAAVGRGEAPAGVQALGPGCSAPPPPGTATAGCPRGAGARA